jgi:phenylalanyl-tRNA synthetase beta chain
MKISLNWLKEFVDVDIVDKDALNNVVVGYVKSLKKHPEADGLNVVQVNAGEETVQIVCGGINLKAKMYVPLALPGAILPGDFKIGNSKIRGVESNGMICAKEELNLGLSGAREIWELDSKKKWVPGTPLIKALKLEKAHSAQEIGDLLSLHTSEVEDVIPADEHLHNVVTGKLITFDKMDATDKLHVGQFDIGWKMVQIVFGSVYKISVDEILPLALAGAVLPGGKIKNTEIQGEKSGGMVCGDDEMGIENSSEGITRFPADTPLGIPVADALGLRDFSYDVDNKSLTHRPDLWGHYGMARELATILKKPLKPFAPLLKYKSMGNPTKKLKVTIKAKDGCPRFSGAVVTGVKIVESPQWIKSRLQAAGVRPINNVVDITNYVMLEMGQPMHAFDRNFVGSDTLIVRYAKKGETLETIDHKKRKLTADDVVVCDAKDKALGMAGIMGGVGSEIKDDTTEVIFEAANWDPVILRKSSQRHNLRSDASQRFEKGVDPILTEQAVQRALALLQLTCPDAKLASQVTTIGSWKAPKLTISFNADSAANKIGTDISATEMVRILKSLGFGVDRKKGSGQQFKVTVPTHRATGDVSLEEDLIEEVARIYGYENIEPILPKLPAKLPMENQERFHKHAARNILANTLGFTEVMNYSFYSKDAFTACGLDEMNHIKVLNFLSSEQTHMRTNMIPGMLQSIQKNNNNYDDMKLFEIGRTYKETGEYMPLEEKWMTGAIARKKQYEPFYEIKGQFEAFIKTFRPGNVQLNESKTPPPYAHPKKCVEVKFRGEFIGYIFELHPGVAKTFDIEHRVGIFEVNFTKLIAHGRQPLDFRPLPKFPGMKFDVSFLVDHKTLIADLEKAIKRADPKRIIQNVELFDMYQGKGVPEDKKSLAFSVELRHNDHTLTDNEFKETHEAVLAAVKKSGGEVK